MEEFSREIVYPTIDQVIDSNRQIIKFSGGFFSHPDNLQNRGSLEYILHAIRFPLYKVFIFPTLISKTAALVFEIIQSHVFYDGNKRTALHTAWEFLHANGEYLILGKSAEDIAINIAQGEVDREELEDWIQINMSNS